MKLCRENLAIINKYTKIPVPLIGASIMPYFEPNGKINMESVGKIQDYMVKRGYTEYDSPMDMNSMVDYSYIQEAVNRIGEFKP